MAAKLWPWRHLDRELPDWAKDEIVCETEIELPLVDRLRVVVSGRMRVRSYTATERLPGRVETQSIAHPIAPAVFQPRMVR